MNDNLTFGSAQRECDDLNAALPAIRSEQENKDVWERMVMVKGKETFAPIFQFVFQEAT